METKQLNNPVYATFSERYLAVSSRIEDAIMQRAKALLLRRGLG
jgi:hypothetical protein